MSKTNQLTQLLNKTSSKYRHAVIDDNLKWSAEKQHLINIISSSKSLVNATPESIANSALQAGSMGLSLNPTLGHCYLIPRRQRKKQPGESWDKYNATVPVIAYASPSYKGLSNIVTASGKIRFIRAEVIFKGDVFNYYGPTTKPNYEMNINSIRNFDNMLGVYAEARTAEGDWLAEFMDRETILKIRDKSDNPNGLLWGKDKFWTEGAKKAVIRRMTKTLPYVSPAMSSAIEVMNNNEGVPVEIESEALTLLSEDQCSELKIMLEHMPETEQERWLKKLGKRFGVKSYEDIPVTEFDKAQDLLKGALNAG